MMIFIYIFRRVFSLSLHYFPVFSTANWFFSRVCISDFLIAVVILFNWNWMHRSFGCCSAGRVSVSDYLHKISNENKNRLLRRCSSQQWSFSFAFVFSPLLCLKSSSIRCLLAQREVFCVASLCCLFDSFAHFNYIILLVCKFYHDRNGIFST